MRSVFFIKIAFFSLVLFSFVTSSWAKENSMVNLSKISLKDNCLFSGRWDHQAEFSRTSAPAAVIQFNASAKTLEFDIEGEARFRVDEDGKEIGLFVSGERKTFKVKTSGDGETHRYRLIKVSESNPGGAKIFGIFMDKSGVVGPTPKHFNRRIEFIGDSFTVGYGCEGQLGDADDLVFIKTNAAKSYAFLLADGFKADFQVNAFSGRGLVRNYDNIVPEWKIPRLYGYTVPGEAPTDLMQKVPEESLKYDFDSFHPQVVVVFVGINDFQGNPPYGDKKEFSEAYRGLLKNLRQLHPGVKFLLVSTKIWPNDDLTPTVKSIYQSEIDAGFKDLEFVEVHTENGALHGHPTEHSQADLARTLRPFVAKLGGWLSR